MNKIDITALKGLTHAEISRGAIPSGNTSVGAVQRWTSGAATPIGIVFDPVFHQQRGESPLIGASDGEEDDFWLAVVAAAVNLWDDEGDEDL